MREGIHWPTAVVVVATMLLLWLAVWLLRRSRRRGFLSEVDRATYATLHTASLASQHLGDGLTPDAAERAGQAPAVHPRRPCRVPVRHRRRAVVDGHR